MSSLGAKSRHRQGSWSFPLDPWSLAARARLWIPTAIEALWLLTVGLVPIVFAPPDFMLFPDVPKVVLLRMFTGLMGLLWVVEWALKPQAETERTEGTLWTRFLSWLKESPASWILVAATSFLLVNVVSTLLSPSISVSLWGSNPGRDGYGLYNTFSYYLLFVVIATRMRSRQQLWRLLAVISLATTASAIYGTLQHFQADPLQLSLNGERVIATFGNALFAGTFFVLAIPISAGLGLVHVMKARSFPIVALWVIIIGVQVLGLVFTFSRGPLATLVVVMGTWLLLIQLIAGSRVFLNALSLLAPAVILVAGVLSGTAIPDTVSILTSSFLDGRIVETSSVSEVAVTDEGSDSSTVTASVQKPDVSTKPEEETLSRSNASGGADAKVIDDPVVSPKLLDDLSASFRVDETAADLKTWNLGGRIPLWKKSAGIILKRPWYDPDQQGSVIVRHLFGYGPEMLRYALPLRWDPAALQTVNASSHNLFLQILVEVGFLGLLSFVALVAVFSVGTVHYLLKGRAQLSKVDLVIYITLLTSVSARLLEQMTGVARVSDTTFFWVLVAILTALPLLSRTADTEDKVSTIQNGQPSSISILKVCLATLVALIGIALIWQKNVPYAEAASLGSNAITAFNREGPFIGLDLIDQAIFKAPDVGQYYIFRIGMMNLIDTRDRDDQVDKAIEVYAYSKLASERNPLSHVAKGHVAVAALNLYQLGDASKGVEAVQTLRELVNMLPGHEPVYVELAYAYLITGQPGEATAVLEEFDTLNRGRTRTSQALQRLRVKIANDLQKSRNAGAAP